MFEKGSYVTYRSEGVCIIIDIREENFGAGNGAEDYYILAPISDIKSTVFVPVNNERLVGYMHRLLQADELNGIISELREERLEWIPESRARNAAFKQLISRGDRRELIVLLNTLYDKIGEMKKTGKRVGTTDLGAMHKAETLLREELMMTTDFRLQDKLIDLLRGNISLVDKK